MELTDSVLDTAQDHTKLNIWDFFSANVHRCNIAFSVVYVQASVLFFVFIKYFFLAGQGSGQFNKEYLCLRLV